MFAGQKCILLRFKGLYLIKIDYFCRGLLLTVIIENLMKKFFLAVAMLFIIGGATTASAQFKFGLVAGMNMSKLSFDNGKYFDSDHRAGWYVGPKVWFNIPIVGLGVNASAQYSQRRMNVKSGDGEDAVSDSKNLNTIEIPINVRYTLGLGSIASVYAETGPQFGFNVGNKTISEVAKFKSSNVTWNVGIGARVLGHLEAGVGYNIALSNFGELVPDQLRGTKNDFKSNTWQVQVAYLF